MRRGNEHVPCRSESKREISSVVAMNIYLLLHVVFDK